MYQNSLKSKHWNLPHNRGKLKSREKNKKTISRREIGNFVSPKICSKRIFSHGVFCDVFIKAKRIKYKRCNKLRYREVRKKNLIFIS